MYGIEMYGIENWNLWGFPKIATKISIMLDISLGFCVFVMPVKQTNVHTFVSLFMDIPPT